MKNMLKLFGIIALVVVVIGFSMTTCGDDSSGGGKGDYTTNSIDELAAWLAKQPPNAASTPYTVKMKVNDLTDFVSLKTTLNTAGKYVYLDFSGSPLTTIPGRAFYGPKSDNAWGCAPLTGITIPNSVTSIDFAFEYCTSLASVTIQCTITYLSSGVMGDLDDKYLAGGIGTYKTTAL